MFPMIFFQTFFALRHISQSFGTSLLIDCLLCFTWLRTKLWSACGRSVNMTLVPEVLTRLGWLSHTCNNVVFYWRVEHASQF